MKHLHPSALPPSAADPDSVTSRIVYPAVPWNCPTCDRQFLNHLFTVATVENPETPENVARATFKCVGCDFRTFDED